MLIKVRNYQLYNNQNNRKLIVNLNQFKKSVKRPLYCFSGGGLIIVNNKYIPVIKRSSTAPTNKNKLSTPSGISDSINEIYNPSLLKREILKN